MLGDVVCRVPEFKSKVSTKLLDHVFENWTETPDVNVATLVEQDETWKEFWLYASGTKYWCPRLCAIKAMYPVLAKKIKADDKWNFGQGHAYHDLFRRRIMPSLGGQFLGSWERYVDVPDRDCGVMAYEVSPSVVPEFDSSMDIVRGWGPKPKGKGWVYNESKVRVNDHRIVVKLDGIVSWNDGLLEVQEIKSEKSTARDDLDPMMGGAPRSHHVDQCMIGMAATGIKDCRLTYVFKGEPYLRTAWMEHEIEYDQSRVDRLFSVADSCVSAVRLCDEKKASVEDDEELFSSPEDSFAWLNEHFDRRDGCPMKSKGDARYCLGRDFCFQKFKKAKK